jgi:hypothetical protein
VIATVIQAEIDKLGDLADGGHGDLRAVWYRWHLEALLCTARLNEAIERAEQWYAQREDELRRFDRRATATVRQLVSDARVRPSLTWSSP